MPSNIVLTKDLFFCRTADFLDGYLVKSCNRSEKTREDYRDALTIFRRYIEYRGKTVLNFKYTDCTTEFMLDYKEYLADVKHYEASSINQRMAAIKSYVEYSYTCDTTLIQVYLTIRALPSSKEAKRQRPIMTDEAVRALINAPKPTSRNGLRDSVIMSLLFDAAIRLDELVGLKVGDIYRDGEKHASLMIHGKGNKERTVALDDKATALLNVYLKAYHKDSSPDAPLIYTVRKGIVSAMSNRNVQKIIKKYSHIASESGVEMPDSVYPHMLRRTKATLLYQNHIPIETISRYLGHSDVSTTKDHYAFASLDQMREATSLGSNREDDQEALWLGHEDELASLCGLRK